MAKISEANHINEPVEKSLGFAASVLSNGTIHLAGIVAVDPALNVVAPGDMAGQVAYIYDAMAHVLATYQATLENVVSETIYVTDIQAFAAAAPIRTERYARWGFPAATVVEVKGLFLPEALVEVQAIATLG
jgi:2-iminobutanoate/2-iminopropanoate deaminase